jgi:GlpG protein
MRQIGTIADEKDARRLADYLLTLKIETKLVPMPAGGQAVWVRREEQVDQARRELDEFLDSPGDPKYQGVAQTAHQIRKEAERAERLHRKNTINLRGQGTYRSLERCPVMFLLLGASLVVAALTMLGEKDSAVRPLQIGTYRVVLFEPAAKDQDVDAGPRAVIQSEGLAAIERGEVWRLITPIFLHFGILHLVFNMFWLYDLGGLIELRKGHWQLALLVLVSGVLSNFGEFAWSSFQNPNFGGMSGVIYALFGYVWMHGRHDPEGGMYLRPNTVLFMLGWFVYCWFGFMPVANVAHTVGLVVGVVVGVAPYWRQELRRWT